jgi:hypothetical protein
MKSLLRLACLAALLPAPAFAAEPTTIDVYRELIRHRTATVGVKEALDYNTRAFVANFLENPNSQYSNLRDDSPITNEIWWYDFVDSLAFEAADKDTVALEMLQWQSGFTKARIDVDIVVDEASASAYQGAHAAANAIKAGVDADIFWKAADMNGAMSTVAAGHAVALQLLSDQIRNIAPDEYEARGIKPDVLTRYLHQDNPEKIDENDLNYLADLLRSAIAKRDFTIDAQGRRQLPAAYRVARVAAAYVNARAYFNTKGYCRGNDLRPLEPVGQAATEYDRPLCFVAATDRAVQSWFRRQMRKEASDVRLAHQATDEASARLSFWLNTVLVLADLAPFVEFGEAAVVEGMVADGDVTEEEASFAEERASQLTCRIRK